MQMSSFRNTTAFIVPLQRPALKFVLSCGRNAWSQAPHISLPFVSHFVASAVVAASRHTLVRIVARRMVKPVSPDGGDEPDGDSKP
jgi:hypothetical protein